MSNLASLASIAQMGAAGVDLAQGASNASGIRAQSGYQQSVLNQNAQAAVMQGNQAQKSAEFAANLRGQQAAQAIGQQRAYTSDAVDVNTGSAARAQGDIRAAAAQDQATIMNNAALQRWGYGLEATNYATQAKMAQINGRFGAKSSLISGGMKFARDASAANYYAKQAGWYDKKPDTVGEYGLEY